MEGTALMLRRREAIGADVARRWRRTPAVLAERRPGMAIMIDGQWNMAVKLNRLGFGCWILDWVL